MTIKEKIKVWKRNATYEGFDIPITLLKTQLLDAANTTEHLLDEVEKLKRGIYEIATGKNKGRERLITISLITGSGARCDVEGCDEEANYMGGGRTCCTFHWVKE